MNAVRDGFSGALEQEIAINPKTQAIRENCVRRFPHGRLHIIFPFLVRNALAFLPPQKIADLGRERYVNRILRNVIAMVRSSVSVRSVVRDSR
jgi:hypothetical protein